jgi:3-phenylpropionate/cinnamic acid dioxygenase small subunit
MFEDWQAISRLLTRYAELIDAGRFSEAAAMFEHSTYAVRRDQGGISASYHGATEVMAFFSGTIIHEDGTPRTRHLVTNVEIELDGDSASARSYVTVLQQTELLPLQPIASGRYLDRFERVDGEWRFAERIVTGFLLGDRSQHVKWSASAPPGQTEPGEL